MAAAERAMDGLERVLKRLDCARLRIEASSAQHFTPALHSSTPLQHFTPALHTSTPHQHSSTNPLGVPLDVVAEYEESQ